MTCNDFDHTSNPLIRFSGAHHQSQVYCQYILEHLYLREHIDGSYLLHSFRLSLVQVEGFKTRSLRRGLGAAFVCRTGRRSMSRIKLLKVCLNEWLLAALAATWLTRKYCSISTRFHFSSKGTAYHSLSHFERPISS